MALWGSIMAIQVFAVISIAMARKSRAKREFVKEMRRSGMPMGLAREIGDDYAPSTLEILNALKSFLRSRSEDRFFF
jgi:hypothetical protein